MLIFHRAYLFFLIIVPAFTMPQAATREHVRTIVEQAAAVPLAEFKASILPKLFSHESISWIDFLRQFSLLSRVSERLPKFQALAESIFPKLNRIVNSNDLDVVHRALVAGADAFEGPLKWAIKHIQTKKDMHSSLLLNARRSVSGLRSLVERAAETEDHEEFTRILDHVFSQDRDVWIQFLMIFITIENQEKFGPKLEILAERFIEVLDNYEAFDRVKQALRAALGKKESETAYVNYAKLHKSTGFRKIDQMLKKELEIISLMSELPDLSADIETNLSPQCQRMITALMQALIAIVDCQMRPDQLIFLRGDLRNANALRRCSLDYEHNIIDARERHFYTEIVNIHRKLIRWMQADSLHVAARRGSVEDVEFLLDEGVNIERLGAFLATALHEAAEAGHVAVVQCLLKRGARWLARNSCGATILHVAAGAGQTNVVRFLCRENFPLEELNHKGETALIVAASYGHSDACKCLLDAGAHINARNGNGLTALHIAARYGHLDVIRLLRFSGADIMTRNEEKQTPLHTAAAWGHTDVVRYLVNMGADVDAEGDHNTPYNTQKVTPLYLAILSDCVPTTRALVELGGNVNQEDSNGETLFTRIMGSPHIVSCMLRGNPNICNDAGQDRVDSLNRRIGLCFREDLVRYFAMRNSFIEGDRLALLCNKRNSTLLYNPLIIVWLAMYFFDLRMLRALRNYNQSLVDRRLIHVNANEQILLIKAITWFDDEALVWLLSTNLFDLTVLDSDGHDVLWHAVDVDNRQAVNRLLAEGAIPTAAHAIHAAQKGFYQIAAQLCFKIRKIHLFR